MDIVRATYDFAAQHPEILKLRAVLLRLRRQGHKANESCFVARRDAKGNVLEWDTHGFGCTICVDVARESMQLYSSGADVALDPRRDREATGRRGNAAGTDADTAISARRSKRGGRARDRVRSHVPVRSRGCLHGHPRREQHLDARRQSTPEDDLRLSAGRR